MECDGKNENKVIFIHSLIKVLSNETKIERGANNVGMSIPPQATTENYSITQNMKSSSNPTQVKNKKFFNVEKKTFSKKKLSLMPSNLKIFILLITLQTVLKHYF